MIKFHIPGIKRFHEINSILIDLLNNHKEYFYDDISIAGIYGTFIPCIWNAGRTFMDEYITDEEKQELVKYYNNLGIGIIYTFTNTSLDARLYADYMGNFDVRCILDNTDINKIIVADEQFKQYLNNTYSDKSLKFILSTTSDIVIDNANNMKGLTEYEDQYDLIVPNYNLNNSKQLLNTKNPSKYEILLNPQCVDNCKFEKEHYKSISNMNIGILNMTEEFKCPYEANSTHALHDMSKNKHFISVEDLYTKYKDKGFQTFKINGRTAADATLVTYYLYYMVKPEYYNEVLTYFPENISEYIDTSGDIITTINSDNNENPIEEDKPPIEYTSGLINE